MLPRRKVNLEIRTVGSEVLVHDTELGKVHVLNYTAGETLSLCDGSHSISDLARVLAKSFGVDATTIESDVADVVRSFSDLQLLENDAPSYTFSIDLS